MFKFLKLKHKCLYFIVIVIILLASIDLLKLLINNCYAYAFNDMSIIKFKRQPGDIANKNSPGSLKDLSKNDYNCEQMTQRILKDYPDTYTLENDTEMCKKDYHKVMLAIDNIGKKQDYHFYKEYTDLYGNHFWQHKPGTTSIRNYDDSGKIITDLKTADRNYDNKNDESEYNYSVLCDAYCVKN